MSGYYDTATGVWFHDELDTFPATATVLNRGQTSIRDALLPLQAVLPLTKQARDAALDAAARAEATADALASAGGIISEDPADPGTYEISVESPLTEDPADPGTYLIGA
jgi:aspartyl/asparaginyl-tRNA synthetase